MDIRKIEKINCIRLTAPTIHAIPDEDSRFYRKFKPEVSLNNPTATYCKYKKYFFSKKD